MNTVIYINGVRRLCTGLDASFYADSDDLPGRNCSQHNIGPAAALHLRSGGSVRTLGNHYSTTPPMAQSKPVPKPTPIGTATVSVRYPRTWGWWAGVILALAMWLGPLFWVLFTAQPSAALTKTKQAQTCTK